MKSQRGKHRERQKNSFFRAAVTLLVFLCMCMSVVRGYAFNADYLDADKWNSNNKVTTMYIEKESNVHRLEGIFKYYADGEEGCIYTYFSVSESSVDENNEDVRIHYDVYTQKEEYSFSIDKNGMCDTLEEEKKAFEVYENFSTNRKTQEGMYITGVRIKEFDSNSSVDVSFYINGHIYRIAKGIELKQAEETTNQGQKSKTTAERTTKRENDKSRSKRRKERKDNIKQNNKVHTAGKQKIFI